MDIIDLQNAAHSIKAIWDVKARAKTSHFNNALSNQFEKFANTKTGKLALDPTNMNAAAATGLCIAMGNNLGAIAFGSAAAIGTVNKWRSLNTASKTSENTEKQNKNALLAALSKPEITGQVMVAAAGVNLLESLYASAFVNDGNGYANLAFAISWAMGLMGDRAFAICDKNIYSDNPQQAQKEFNKWLDTVKEKSPRSAAWKIIEANPSAFFVGLGFFQALGFLLKDDQDIGTGAQIAAIATMTIAASGTGHVVKQVNKFIKGEIPAGEINDGVVNYRAAYSDITLGSFAAMTANPALALSKMVFAISNMRQAVTSREATTGEKPDTPQPQP